MDRALPSRRYQGGFKLNQPMMGGDFRQSAPL